MARYSAVQSHKPFRFAEQYYFFTATFIKKKIISREHTPAVFLNLIKNTF